MKKIIIIFISAFCLIAVGLAALMIVAVYKGGYQMVNVNENSKVKLVNTDTINISGIESIRISYYYDDIIFCKSDTDELILKEYKNFTPKEDELARTSISGSKLYIHGDKGNSSWFLNRNGRLEVYLPVEYSGILDVSTSSGNISSDLSLKLSKFCGAATSGDIILNEIEADSIDVSASSGNIIIERAQGKRKISTTSGDIEVNDGSGESSFSASSGNITVNKASGLLNAVATSGDIEINDSTGDKEIESSSGNITLNNSQGFVKASASSGDIMITELNGAGDLRTTSGEIGMELTEMTDNINLEASSGDVTLQLPASAGFNFTANATSGDIGTSFDDQLSYNKDRNNATGAIGDNTDRFVKINTTSGNITVKNK